MEAILARFLNASKLKNSNFFLSRFFANLMLLGPLCHDGAIYVVVGVYGLAWAAHSCAKMAQPDAKRPSFEQLWRVNPIPHIPNHCTQQHHHVVSLTNSSLPLQLLMGYTLGQ